MTRYTLAATLALGVFGAARAQDFVYYYDRAAKKEEEHRGKIEAESPAGLTVRVKEAKDDVVKKVAAADVTQVIYGGTGVDRLTYRGPFGKLDRAAKEPDKARREKGLAEALDGFAKLEQQVGGVPNAKRYIQYKVAEVTAQQAQDDPTKVEPAIKLLSEFKAAHANAWTIVPALKTLARLQEDSGKTDDARKTYEELADLPDIPPAVKQESAVLVGRLLLRGGQYADAERRLKSLASAMSAADAQLPFVKAYLVESRLGRGQLDGVPKDLAEVIKSSGDARLRGVAHNLLGDYYLKKGQQDEAFWHYLRVDAMYNEDAEEHAKALFQLATLFDKVKKDPLRGKECAARLMEPRFAGTPYPRRLAAGGKK
jgi:tetratricopeptide (TPR) repeat protein